MIGNGTYSALAALSACLLSASCSCRRRCGLWAFKSWSARTSPVAAPMPPSASLHRHSQMIPAPPLSSIRAATPPRSTIGFFCCRSRPELRVRPTCSPRASWSNRCLTAIARSGAGAAFVAVDAIPTEDSRTAPPFRLPGTGRLARQPRPDSRQPAEATRRADAARNRADGNLKGTQVQTMSLLADLQQRLGGSSAVTLSFVHPPVTAGLSRRCTAACCRPHSCGRPNPARSAGSVAVRRADDGCGSQADPDSAGSTGLL